eukprot:CAMPEP_0195095794 /NCGR_PEP_ID=MMETSP0448-20130528/48733_1 /TAXON_ID=66468 /ORGANISM="Heterocapsa triquestra, Strain CCMP 448" /LENGTH=52 /DNA_ID=CAMNT_0040130075 /DNA_START=30 /DNA_END=188 /DNA_ORIENTATION=-
MAKEHDAAVSARAMADCPPHELQLTVFFALHGGPRFGTAAATAGCSALPPAI